MSELTDFMFWIVSCGVSFTAGAIFMDSFKITKKEREFMRGFEAGKRHVHSENSAVSELLQPRFYGNKGVVDLQQHYALQQQYARRGRYGSA